jgi:hypothetical protein
LKLAAHFLHKLLIFENSAGIESITSLIHWFQGLGIWTRSRIPTPIRLLDRPLRAVFELAHAELLGDLRGDLVFNSLPSFGTGFEIDCSASDPLFSRVRVVFRYQFGQNVHSTSIGLAASF